MDVNQTYQYRPRKTKKLIPKNVNIFFDFFIYFSFQTTQQSAAKKPFDINLEVFNQTKSTPFFFKMI